MTIRRCAAVAMGLSVLCAGMAGTAAPRKKPSPAKKPAATKRVVRGTTQLKGDQARFGLEYTLGQAYPMNVMLKSAEYTVTPLKIGDTLYIPASGQKLLVLHYTLHNPRPQESLVRFDTFQFTVVDAGNANQEFVGDVGAEATRQTLDMNLKPGQKIDAYTGVMLPAKGEAPKLIVKSPDNLVLRYDLKGKAKPLAAPFADPADKAGATALEKVPAVMGTFYPAGNIELKLDGAAFQEEKIGDEDLSEGNRFFVIAITARNVAPSKQMLRFDTFALTLRDADGANVEWNQSLLQASRNNPIDMELDPGQEIRGRFFFQVPKDLALKDLSIREGSEGRAFVYDVSGAK